jgi:hypothetical protein
LCENFFVSVGEILSQICVYVWNFGRFVLELEAGFSNLGFQLSDLSMSFFVWVSGEPEAKTTLLGAEGG